MANKKAGPIVEARKQERIDNSESRHCSQDHATYCGGGGGGGVPLGDVLPGLLGFGVLVGGFVLPVGG
jgi:hypothetical protein